MYTSNVSFSFLYPECEKIQFMRQLLHDINRATISNTRHVHVIILCDIIIYVRYFITRVYNSKWRMSHLAILLDFTIVKIVE